MKLAFFELRQPDTLNEALSQLSALGSDAQVLAGGQSLVPLMRYRVLKPHVLLDINRVSGLSHLKLEASDGLHIGALVRHVDLERVTQQHTTPLAHLISAHAKQIAFWAIRNKGTAVGSIMQADPKGDWPLLFCALDACIELQSLRGKRSVAVRDFLLGPLLTTRAVDELATALTLCASNARITRWGRSKLMHRAGEYAMCSAIVIDRNGAWECWVGAGGDKPVPLPELAKALSTNDERSPQVLLHAAKSDVASQWPDIESLARHRHAVNAVDAALQALDKKSNT